MGIAGVDFHLEFMEFIRRFYRNTFVEVVLLGAIAVQLLIGGYFVFRSWGKRRGFFQRAQVISGCYLIYFLLAHVNAVLDGRSAGLDTNFYFATAGMYIGELYLFFVPHYFLAVLAVFTHLACALHHYLLQTRHAAMANTYAGSVVGIGALASAAIVMSLTGLFYDVTVPVEYSQFFESG